VVSVDADEAAYKPTGPLVERDQGSDRKGIVLADRVVRLSRPFSASAARVPRRKPHIVALVPPGSTSRQRPLSTTREGGKEFGTPSRTLHEAAGR
jgi:hypothetical protein